MSSLTVTCTDDAVVLQSGFRLPFDIGILQCVHVTRRPETKPTTKTIAYDGRQTDRLDDDYTLYLYDHDD